MKNSSISNRNAERFQISIKDYFFAYSTDIKIREFIDSGNFVYVDERLVIKDKIFVEQNERGLPRLTDYAMQNQHECCLLIDKKDYQGTAKDLFAIDWNNGIESIFIKNIQETQSVYMQASGEQIANKVKEYNRLINILIDTEHEIGKSLNSLLSENTDWYNRIKAPDVLRRAIHEIARQRYEIEILCEKTRQEVSALQELDQCAAPVFDTSDHNMELFERSEELKKLHGTLIENIGYIAENKKTFSQLAWEQMQRCKCYYKETFREKTLLSDKTFDRIKAGKLKSPDIETIMAICIGLNLGVLYGEQLLKSAGYDLSASSIPLHKIYHVLLCTFHDRDIFEWNEVLEALGQPPINFKAYKETIGGIFL